MGFRPDAAEPTPYRERSIGQLEGAVAKEVLVSVGALAMAAVTPGVRGLLLVAVSGFSAVGIVPGIIELRARRGGTDA